MADPDLKSEGRIRYADDEIERAPRATSTGLRRTRSRDSSRSSISRARTQVEPGVALPIQYRTISFNVADSQERLPDKSKVHDVTEDIVALEWHLLTTDDVLERLSVSTAQGLSSDQVARKTKEFGRNVLSPPPSQWFRQIFVYLFGQFGSILFVASILVFIAWKPLGEPAPAPANLGLAIVLAVIWVIQAGFAFYQDWSSSRVMSSIKNLMPSDSLVLRDGVKKEMTSEDLVPGDIIYIRLGDKLPADVRYIETSPDAKFDRSILTGEVDPLRGVVDSTEKNYMETPCIGMAGTHCVSGTAVGVVVSTGDRSVFGQLAKLTSQPDNSLTLLEKEIYWFVAAIVTVMVSMILLFVIVWATWIRHDYPDWLTPSLLIVGCVSVAVAFIPEGLPIAVASSLTITASVMKKNNILCKSLKTVETLGSVSTICSDKTGTLTKNMMAVSDFLIGTEELPAAAAAGYIHAGLKNGDPTKLAGAITQLAEVSAICNAGEFDAATNHLPVDQRKVMGDATDSAILRFAESLVPVTSTREKWKRIYKVAFNSKNKFMIQVIGLSDTEASKSGDKPQITIKGAPDILLPRCLFYMDSKGETQPLSNEHRDYIETVKNRWSAQGKRVILLARKAIPAKHFLLGIQTPEFEDKIMEESRGQLELIGIVGIVDPPRDEIPEVIRTLRGAGIKVHMVTGDFKLTAQAIAAECGIITVPQDAVEGASALSYASPSDFMPEASGTRAIAISGDELKSLDESQWSRLCAYDEIVFARTTPEQKLRIVKELQSRGEIVGMTGDGVNDAPSLKKADIGIAVGSGSDIAIEAADMVLLDSFAAIIEAVKYGRVVFDNLKKTICYLLPAGSFAEFWPVFTNVIFGLPQILSSFLMIIICCFTDCAAATAIAYEKPEADVLLRRPRNPKKDHLVDWRLILQAYGITGFLQTTLSFTMSYWWMQRQGLPFSTLWFGFGATPEGMSDERKLELLNTGSSIYFITLVVMQWFNLMAVRTRRLSIIQHPPLFRKATQNWYLFPAIIFALVFAIFFLYVPAFHDDLGTTHVPVEHWFIPFGLGMGILLIDEARKWSVRKYPKGFLAKIAW